MIDRIQLLRNVGQFDNVSPQQPFTPLTLIYGENGRGKTTVAEILRSLATNDPVLGHVDKWRSQSLMQAMSMKPRKLSAVLS
ncbi:AAA family ATPase [Paracoccus pantotrophus]|uniref:AAA family ATPase n=1 Tax=Paracoccus pantotrophus TaxID=82367 RepID=UPI001E2B1353|nr:AAA family ATPase [Paracoccus pantotrophus]